jgi:nicotinamide-nucleotide amidase
VPDAVDLIAELTRRRLTVAIAESLTGGELSAALTAPAGASAVVLGGAVVYATELKQLLIGVDAELLERHGPVHPDVAVQLASGVRTALAVAGRPADIGIATTGVAGPDPQGGQPPGTVYVGISTAAGTRAVALRLAGTRAEIRRQSVDAALETIAEALSADSASGE